MPGGQPKFVFVGKEPLVLWIAVSLLFANTVLMLLPESNEKDLFARVAPEVAPWYVDHAITIQLVLLAALVAIFIIFRKRVRFLRRK